MTSEIFSSQEWIFFQVFFLLIFFFSDCRRNLAFKVHANTIHVGSVFLILLALFWGVIPVNLMASLALERQAGCA